MALPLIAMGVAAAGAGAAGGMMQKKKKEKLEYAQEQKPFMRAAQAQIPLYLQVMSGGMPSFLKRYLQQTQGALQQQTGMNIQDYLRQTGKRGMDFGPSVAAGMSNIYGAATPALAQGLTQARSSIMERGMGAMQQWSAMTPQKMMRTKQPSIGMMAGAGALQGLSRGMGQMMQPGQAAPTGTTPSPQAQPQLVPQGSTMGGGKLIRR